MEKTLMLLKPSALQRNLVGEVLSRFEKKGLRLAGIKMMVLDDAIVAEHYSHLLSKPFYPEIKASMQATPVIAVCWEGIEAVEVVRTMTGSTNGRKAMPGTIRGDYSMSVLENIVHTSDSLETAAVELKRFFKEEELFNYPMSSSAFLNSPDEL